MRAPSSSVTCSATSGITRSPEPGTAATARRSPIQGFTSSVVVQARAPLRLLRDLLEQPLAHVVAAADLQLVAERRELAEDLDGLDLLRRGRVEVEADVADRASTGRRRPAALPPANSWATAAATHPDDGDHRDGGPGDEAAAAAPAGAAAAGRWAAAWRRRGRGTRAGQDRSSTCFPQSAAPAESRGRGDVCADSLEAGRGSGRGSAESPRSDCSPWPGSGARPRSTNRAPASTPTGQPSQTSGVSTSSCSGTLSPTAGGPQRGLGVARAEQVPDQQHRRRRPAPNPTRSRPLVSSGSRGRHAPSTRPASSPATAPITTNQASAVKDLPRLVLAHRAALRGLGELRRVDQQPPDHAADHPDHRAAEHRARASGVATGQPGPRRAWAGRISRPGSSGPAAP